MLSHFDDDRFNNLTPSLTAGKPQKRTSRKSGSNLSSFRRGVSRAVAARGRRATSVNTSINASCDPNPPSSPTPSASLPLGCEQKDNGGRRWRLQVLVNASASSWPYAHDVPERSRFPVWNAKVHASRHAPTPLRRSAQAVLFILKVALDDRAKDRARWRPHLLLWQTRMCSLPKDNARKTRITFGGPLRCSALESRKKCEPRGPRRSTVCALSAPSLRPNRMLYKSFSAIFSLSSRRGTA